MGIHRWVEGTFVIDLQKSAIDKSRMVHILASGVFFTGFIKDMLSLPRPLSPPLQRITMSGSAALEYGFPSTHSANAVSVAVYTLFAIHSPDCEMHDTTKLILEVVSYFYAFSIILGRLYCGMHGFLDVIIGSIVGAIISAVEYMYAPDMDRFLHNSSWVGPAIIAIVIIGLVRIHPEPADDCPCFDDSVSFAGVMIGVELGVWHYAASGWATNVPVPGTVPFDLEHMGLLVAISRILVGVFVIFSWREVMKPTLLKVLPHLFRVIERSGFILPRKFFMSASEYQKIPSGLKVDNVMPSVSDLPGFLHSIRHPGRGRSVSVGPQSAADAYETLAYREKRRRDSLTSSTAEGAPGFRSQSPPTKQNDYYSVPRSADKNGVVSQVSGISSVVGSAGTGNLPTQAQSKIGSYEQMMGQGRVFQGPTQPISESVRDGNAEEALVEDQNELGETEIFSQLEKPRVRYDVEVVTKLVVYSGKFSKPYSLTQLIFAGIAWLAVEMNPIIFEIIGLGMGQHRPVR